MGERLFAFIPTLNPFYMIETIGNSSYLTRNTRKNEEGTNQDYRRYNAKFDR